MAFDQPFSYYYETSTPTTSANGLTSPLGNGSTQSGTFANLTGKCRWRRQTSLRPISSPSTATGTIQNDDKVNVTIGDKTITEGTGGTNTMTFVVTVDAQVEDGFSLGHSLLLVDAETTDLTLLTTAANLPWQ
ncbi:MAG: hypothetical protein R3C28_14385 [Pirellulaceae bacterium]